MSAGTPSSDHGWTIVRVVDLSASRRRLDYVLADGTRRHAVIDRELDSPELRERVAAALISEAFRLHRPGGPRERGPVRPSPWITS